jgi:cell division protease FtsH
VVAKLLPHADPVHEVSIIPRGMAGGYTMTLPEEDQYYVSKEEMLDRITELLGGRAAESLVMNDVSTGASNDIEKATSIARKMITEYGMSDVIGPITLGTKEEEVFLGRDLGSYRNYSEKVAALVDGEIKHIIEESYKKAENLLRNNINKLHKVAQALMEKEKLGEQEFNEVFASA